MNLDSKYYDSVRFDKSPRAPIATRRCDWDNCNAPAPYRAPLTAREQSQAPQQNCYRWLCGAHIGLYNRQFNFFAGMSDRDATRWQHDATTSWHRPTWKRHPYGHPSDNWWRTQTRLEDLLADVYSNAPPKTNGAPTSYGQYRPITKGQKYALDILGLPHTATTAMLTKRYKTLVKRYHPDTNNGARHHELALTRVLRAYKHLKDSGFATI